MDINQTSVLMIVCQVSLLRYAIFLRYAMCSAIAATGVPALVMAKGHVIANIPEVTWIKYTGL